MEKFSLIYDFLRDLILNFRIELGITIKDFCKTSSVSSSTYGKLVKQQQVKPECYARLVIGFCRVATLEEFMTFWMKFGEWIYGEYGER